jgi:hypothetical protein
MKSPENKKLYDRSNKNMNSLLSKQSPNHQSMRSQQKTGSKIHHLFDFDTDTPPIENKSPKNGKQRAENGEIPTKENKTAPLR